MEAGSPPGASVAQAYTVNTPKQTGSTLYPNTTGLCAPGKLHPRCGHSESPPRGS